MSNCDWERWQQLNIAPFFFLCTQKKPLLSYNVRQTHFQVISDQGEVSDASASSESSVSGLIFISRWNEDIREPVKWGHTCTTRGREKYSLSLSCTAGPPCSSVKWRNYPLAYINAECNSCASNYEEGAHADGGKSLPQACATLWWGWEWASAASHVKELPLSFSFFALTPSRGKLKDLKMFCGLSSLVVTNRKRERQNCDGKELQKYIPCWVNPSLFNKKGQRGHTQ